LQHVPSNRYGAARPGRNAAPAWNVARTIVRAKAGPQREIACARPADRGLRGAKGLSRTAGTHDFNVNQHFQPTGRGMANNRRKLIAGNWKMNGLERDGTALAAAVAAGRSAESGAEILICPPFTLIAAVAGAIAGSVVRLGAQDCHAKPSGAFTGDIAAPMLADAGCSHVIVGHSERRALHGESSADVRAKAEAALAAGLIPIVCVGETEAERDAGQSRRGLRAGLGDRYRAHAEPRRNRRGAGRDPPQAGGLRR
jgi:hypothetical protein